MAGGSGRPEKIQREPIDALLDPPPRNHRNYNQLTGTIPASLGNLTSLTVL
jgi:hypothetical protein